MKHANWVKHRNEWKYQKTTIKKIRGAASESMHFVAYWLHQVFYTVRSANKSKKFLLIPLYFEM